MGGWHAERIAWSRIADPAVRSNCSLAYRTGILARHYGDAMRIAQIAPLTESVPPKLYGGTERVVSYITEALVDLGHDVTLFASGDSVTNAKLEAVWPRALRLDPAFATASRRICC